MDSGLNRVRDGLSRLRGDAHGGVGRVGGDVTEIRGAIAELRNQVSEFSSAASELRAALRAAGPEPVAMQAQAAADAAHRHAVAAEAGLGGLSGEFSGLQRGLAKP